jgi:hypothetical protein
MTCCKCRKFFWPIRQGTATTRPSLLSLLAVCFDAPHVRVCVAIMCALSVAVATCRSSKWLELHSHLRRNCVCSGQLTTVRVAQQPLRPSALSSQPSSNWSSRFPLVNATHLVPSYSIGQCTHANPAHVLWPLVTCCSTSGCASGILSYDK